MRKYFLECIGAFCLYALILVISLLWLKHHPAAPWKYLIATLPVLPALLIPATVVRYFRRQDELWQKVQLEGMAFGFMAAAVVTTTIGFLENAGLRRPSWLFVWSVMAACWTIGLFRASRRYR